MHQRILMQFSLLDLNRNGTHEGINFTLHVANVAYTIL